MTTKQLTTAALLGAPFLAIGVYVEMYVPDMGNSWWTGAWGLLYLTGWMASLILLQRKGFAGDGWFGRGSVATVLALLVVANVSNVWQLVAPTYKPGAFWMLDMAWPLSNVLMLAVGGAVLRAGRLAGWARWVPLAVGLWLPLSLALKTTPVALHVSNLYSAVAWTLLALALRSKKPARTAALA